MATLAQTLQTTTPVSPLLRRARRLGLCGIRDFISLAVARGCRHYQAAAGDLPPHPSATAIRNDELTILLLVGECPYDPTAIRCAAQLARSPDVTPARLARLAVMEKCERVLAHIARAGALHDAQGARFWNEILSLLPGQPPRHEVDLPHWSRFVSMPGIRRTGPAAPTWLTPRP